MRYLLALAFLFMCKCSFAQGISYDEFKREAKEKINLQPEYGNFKKTKEHIEADNEFIKTSLSQYGSERKASEQMIKFGFDYLYRGDFITAMKRFNQAWLLDNKNENAYWGFASVYFSFGDYKAALVQLDKGLVINPKSSNILTDKATIYTGYYASSQNIEHLNKAIDLLNKSYNIDPLNHNTQFKLSVAYFYKKDCVNAIRYFNEHNKTGGNAIPQDYATALKQLCNK